MKKLWLLIPAAALITLIVSTIVEWNRLMYNTGGYNCTPRTCPNGAIHNYNFNSGFGSIIIPYLLQIVSAIILLWWRDQCHVTGCYWPGLPHKTAAGDHACWRHHPERHFTVHALHRRHHNAQAADVPKPI